MLLPDSAYYSSDTGFQRSGLLEEWLPDHSEQAHARSALQQAIQDSHGIHDWHWPDEPIYFISDLHADVDALEASLLATGRIAIDEDEYRLKSSDEPVTFIIGGDSLDKGPNNLALLRGIRRLIETKARVILLAGNHDIRLFMGLQSLAQPRHVLNEHLFLRMGTKVVPLFKEIFESYLLHRRGNPLLFEEECRQRFFPADDWFERFPEAARGIISDSAIDKELTRTRRKLGEFEAAFSAAGMSLCDVYHTVEYCQQLFLHENGEFSWFFRDMQLAYQEGSFLFIHAGVDDRIAEGLSQQGIESLNQDFYQQKQGDLFDFYFGPLVNTIRTKYRDSDWPLTEQGIRHLKQSGIHTIVHGHQNRLNGQGMMLRHGMINIEGDVTLDRNSRSKEGLKGIGAGVTVIEPQGRVCGISNDYPKIKTFEPGKYLQS